MAPPASLPSAASIAAKAKNAYDATYVPPRTPLATDIEEQAQFFFDRGELATVYLPTLVDKDAFAGQPNAGHYAVADLLLVHAIQAAITTNVDTLIETAGQLLFGQVGAGIDAVAMTALPVGTAPLLKIHGCRASDPANTVWAPGQLNIQPIAGRIAGSSTWLTVQLANRDLLIVGYWTDWDYLNAVLGTTLGKVNPAKVTIVDPAETTSFQHKAPELYALGERASTHFRHVRTSGADFLDALRRRFSSVYVKRILHAGVADYQNLSAQAPPPALTEPPQIDNAALWRMRRDLEGRLPNEPAKERQPSAGPLLGTTILQVRARGATPEDSYWRLDGKRIRILRADGKPLHRVEAEYGQEVAPVVAPDIVIAVGAEALSLPANIARAGTAPTITRGNPSRWLTRAEAVQELNL